MKLNYGLYSSIVGGLFAISSQFFSEAVYARSAVDASVCQQSGEYVTFAWHPVFKGAPRLQVLDRFDKEGKHEHIFFCSDGIISDNVGFGSDSQRFTYSRQALDKGLAPDKSKIDDFKPIDSERYDSKIIRLVLEEGFPGMKCDLRNDGQYFVLGNNCQKFTSETRNKYWRKMFVGNWIGEGYGCERGGLSERVRINIDGNSLTATKITGDNCVPSGNVTFRGTIPNSVSKGSSFPVTWTIGTPDRPASGSTSQPLTILDANSFSSFGAKFTRVK
ncbi:Cyclin D1-binding domain-containing protein [Pseudanabaena sp. BC1403]|uniref:Cyclin D1-binding domain-containing protein n=1 Tax=Pseudanabaena sp. BC1403 TaxID=2043171 RepID=UPI000CD9E49B|nr:Cyclin D1-binding domain-containing protein [Pseudanabaena sp. BC1403]